MIAISKLVGLAGAPWITQTLTEPSVYLDTWAIRRFAEDPALGARFRAALLARGGTLALSALSLADFVGLSDPRHTEAAGEFIDSLGASLFFIEFDPFKVREREYDVIAGRTRECPAGDCGFLWQFAEPAIYRHQPMGVRAWFAAVHGHRDKLLTQRDELGTTVFKAIDALRARATAEPGIRSDMRQPLRGADRPRATNMLLRVLIADVEADQALPRNPSTGIDLFQSIVPAAYCTYVLIDGAWQPRISRTKEMIASEGFKARVATAYSGRDDGVERFLGELEQPALATRAERTAHAA